MPAHKGNKYSPGRTPGTKNEKTLQWEELGHALVTRHSERANEILNNCPDDKFMDHYGKLLEYFKPKLGRTEIKQDGSTEITIRVIEGNDSDQQP